MRIAGILRQGYRQRPLPAPVAERRWAPAPSSRPGGERGSALVLALVILGVISTLGTTMLMSSITERKVSAYHWQKTQALAAAETGLAFAARAIQDMNAPLEDSDGDGQPDFTLAGKITGGGEYTVIAETIDTRAIGAETYRTERFTIVAEGRFGPAVRRVTIGLEHDSFLKFQRLVADDTIYYDCGTTLQGEIYMKGDYYVPTNCDKGSVEFLEPLSVQQQVINAEFAVFHKGYGEYADFIDIKGSLDLDQARSRAQGKLPDCSCEGRGEVGIYCDIEQGIFPLLAAVGEKVTPPAVYKLDLGRFDFVDAASVPGDTIISYAGYPVANSLTGEPLTPGDFNGVIFCESVCNVQGTLDGRSARSMTIFASDTLYITGDLVVGHTGYDPDTGAPTGTGEPVHLGLVTPSEVLIEKSTPRILRVDAAIMSTYQMVRAEGSITDHPALSIGTFDLDMDGIYGETPCNEEFGPGTGWDELNVTSDTWVLNVTGPVITWYKNDSGVWKDSTILDKADGSTRRWSYDMDIMAFPPPCFPKPVNLWTETSWSEIRDAERTLETYLPL